MNAATASSEDSSKSEEEQEKCKNFEESIESMNPMDFKNHFRLRRSTAEDLILRFSESENLSDTDCGGIKHVSCRRSVYIYLWYVGNTVTYRQLGNLFGVSVSTAWSTVKTVATFLISIGRDYVSWPRGVAALDIINTFERKHKIPGIIGAIDCTHIPIKKPQNHEEDYFNRKQVTCGEPGSLHDYRVLRKSKLYRMAQSRYEEIFPNSTFIIGDFAYPSTNWIVSPYKNYGNLTDSQKKFNEKHSSARIVVENAFGLLKTRFRRLLKFTEQTILAAITNIVVSVCILHNICIIKDDLFENAESNSQNNDEQQADEEHELDHVHS
ncbi:putative nuclease HARBI1 [Teleopsis dalmanni]|uniref:putative nuclease HARBI1 n=1 Tax=Teleopsis dalmanni TaxID=139649 RepID=UPI0018CC99E6|nr:putative nuclease HARBI1 [Teleopsis dalmanni]